MSYTITSTYALDPSYAGASLRCQLVQYSAGAQVNSGSPIATGFFEQSGGQGLFDHALSVADDFVGWAHIYDNAAPSVILASFPINPRELEYSDARSSSILGGVNGLISTIGAAGAGLTALPGMVWSDSVRTLSSFGTLVADIWNYVTRTLTSGGGGGGATVEEIWTYAWRTLTGNPAQPSAAAPVFTLASAVAGATRPIQVITWMRDGTTPEPLTGATLTGRIRNEQTLQTRDIVGALEITDAAGGIFAWHYDAQDVAQPGVFSVQFTATFATAPVTARTVIGSWTVYESLS